MKEIFGSVCLNHPDTPAGARCTAYGKPVCKAYAISLGGSSCCSDAGADEAEHAASRYKRPRENAAE